MNLVGIDAALGVAAIAFGMVMTPGPNMMYLVARTLSQGRVAGLLTLAGVVTGLAFYILATAAGLAVLFAAVPVLFVVVKAVGAAYLLWLAYGMLRARTTFRPQDLPMHSRRRLFGMGMVTCLLNPKIALMYAALLPQFVDPSAGATAWQITQLGGVQLIIAATINACWVLGAAALTRVLAQSDLAERVVRYVTGTLLGGFAIHLGLARPTH